MSEPKRFEIFVNPDKYGYIECNNCNGYGSSFNEPAERCTVCDGLGVVKKDSSYDSRPGSSSTEVEI